MAGFSFAARDDKRGRTEQVTGRPVKGCSSPPRASKQYPRVVVVVGGSPLHFVLRTSLGLRNVNEVVEGVAYGRSLRVCDLEGSGGGC